VVVLSCLISLHMSVVFNGSVSKIFTMSFLDWDLGKFHSSLSIFNLFLLKKKSNFEPVSVSSFLILAKKDGISVRSKFTIRPERVGQFKSNFWLQFILFLCSFVKVETEWVCWKDRGMRRRAFATSSYI
jgi:hypothetical protein